MISHGSAPFLECSSRGDKRFSAFYARVKSRGGKSIEEIYQASKIFEGEQTGLDWRSAKGRSAINVDDCIKLYAILWDEFMAENPHLLPVIQQATGLSDRFGVKGHCCQATELWRIRNASLGIVGVASEDVEPQLF